ncbi:hypothetical protein [Anabaena lutea]|uniref:Uncharacterized protein n=1 Tax=Anabaena lutea FACHB-196 TaxID=2692881 RepID=A0ABR8FDN1_9NOST|nr:hypothetical protein [Anabaena lutea]MBD2567039.1 hypothetical protein [Anabaena lutea FACHB-196]
MQYSLIFRHQNCGFKQVIWLDWLILINGNYRTAKSVSRKKHGSGDDCSFLDCGGCSWQFYVIQLIQKQVFYDINKNTVILAASRRLIIEVYNQWA